MKRPIYLIALIALILIAVVVYQLYYIYTKSSPTPMAAIGEVRPDLGPIIHEVETDQGKIIFFVTGPSDQAAIQAEYVKKTLFGWEWGFGGGHTVPDKIIEYNDLSAWSHQYFHSTSGTPFESPFPMLFGILNDETIDGVQIKSKTTGDVFDTTVITPDPYSKRLWYRLLDDEQGEQFTITAYTKDTIYSTREIDEQIPSSADAGTSER
ncbi:hypothetical protein [Paenibacillus daejeonensis]|uniref:hypothetical protein n=1 Tax=Paenibacillus daejeonensis TaxID=135193 RepID=UPI00036C3D1F|nr:hypothetical protein [Paenibacillus daejeonensis]